MMAQGALPHYRPLIGITGPDEGGLPAWLFTRWAVARAGGRPARITPSRAFAREALEGLVIGGGADVSLTHEDETHALPHKPKRVPKLLLRFPLRLLDLLLAPLVLLVRVLAGRHKAMAPDKARDILELSLLKHAREVDLPVLGICRGAQLMSVAEGGTLLRDLKTLYDERPELYTVLARRPIRIAPDSRLRTVMGRDELLVNSLHFHAVGQAGRSMQIVAREDSGVPQAIEHPGRRFWVGVQWHPEYLPHHSAQQELFRNLVKEATARAQATHVYL